MTDERLRFDEAYEVAQQENINRIHEQALTENELIDWLRLTDCRE